MRENVYTQKYLLSQYVLVGKCLGGKCPGGLCPRTRTPELEVLAILKGGGEQKVSSLKKGDAKHFTVF